MHLIRRSRKPLGKNWDGRQKNLLERKTTALSRDLVNLTSKNKVDGSVAQKTPEQVEMLAHLDKHEHNLKRSIFTSSATEVSNERDNQVSSGQGGRRWKEGKPQTLANRLYMSNNSVRKIAFANNSSSTSLENSLKFWSTFCVWQCRYLE